MRHSAVVKSVLCASALAVSAPARGVEFAASVEDLPIMDGLVDTGEGFPFETPRGRIVRVVAAGTVEPAAVAVFYAETLPHLGWRREEGGRLDFERSGEQLIIEVAESPQGGARVTFTVRPARNSTP